MIFVGIDQTGAVQTGRPHLPRPLPCAWLDPKNMQLRVCKNGIKRLDPMALLQITGQHSRKKQRVMVLLDCVIGLPNPLGKSVFEQSLHRLQQLQAQDPLLPFGRAPAEAFFQETLNNHLGPRAPIPARTCEVIASANSVFRARPYQKNIQTGTYRLWREISMARAGLALWPFDPPSRVTVFEAYPSLVWREVFGLPSRKPALLTRKLKDLGVRVQSGDSRLIQRDADLADAVALAVGGWTLQRQGLLGASLLAKLSRSHHSIALREGWIAGLLPSSANPKPSKVDRPRRV